MQDVLKHYDIFIFASIKTASWKAWLCYGNQSLRGAETVLKAQFKKADQKIAFEQKAISIWKVMQFFLF